MDTQTMVNLTQLPIGMTCVIERVVAPDNAPEWSPWLAEIGFLTGEQVCVKRRSLLPQGALVVGVGQSTFALHSDEAKCVWVRPYADSSCVTPVLKG